MAGTNNIIRGDTVAIALSELGELIDRMTNTLTGAHVFVGSLLANYSSLRRQVATEEFSAGVFDQAIAPRKNLPNENQLTFVDIFSMSLKQFKDCR